MHSKDNFPVIPSLAGLVLSLKLQKDIKNVSQWSSNNKMRLHEKKFQLMIYPLGKSKLLRELPFTSETLSYVTEGGTNVEPEQHVKDLGVWLSADGTWTYHINDIVRRANRIAGWILSVFRCRSQEVLLTLYKALVRPILEYCCLVWSPSKVADIQALENVQRAYMG